VGRDSFFIYKIKLVTASIQAQSAALLMLSNNFCLSQHNFSMTLLVQNSSWLPALGHAASSVVTLKPAAFVSAIGVLQGWDSNKEWDDVAFSMPVCKIL
jgi:hypothetical protein